MFTKVTKDHVGERWHHNGKARVTILEVDDGFVQYLQETDGKVLERDAFSFSCRYTRPMSMDAAMDILETVDVDDTFDV